jgi:uncharacterized Zn finger protein (UPF0148 family)
VKIIGLLDKANLLVLVWEGACMAIQLSCSCGKRFRVRDDLLGKKVKCPSCSRVVRVEEEPDEEEIDTSIRTKKKVNDDSSRSTSSRKSRPQKRTSLGLVLGIGGLALVAAIVVLVVVLNQGPNKDGQKQPGPEAKGKAPEGTGVERQA